MAGRLSALEKRCHSTVVFCNLVTGIVALSQYQPFLTVYGEAESFLQTSLSHFDRAYAAHFETHLSFLEPLLTHVHRSRGKRLRPLLHFLVQGLICGCVDENVLTAVLLELLHTASLIHDDVVDEADIRRGRDTVNTRWGNKVAVLTGDYLFADILSLGVEAGGNGVISIVARTARQMGSGELRQTLLSGTSLPNRNAYFKDIEDKTASLYAAAAEMGALLAHASAEEKQRATEFGRRFGLLFQIRDDILDFTGDDSQLGKPVLQDVRDGKATLPLILAAQHANAETLRRIETALNRCDETDVSWVQDFVEEHSGIAAAQAEAASQARQAVALLDDFGPSQYKQLLVKLVLADLERQQ